MIDNMLQKLVDRFENLEDRVEEIRSDEKEVIGEVTRSGYNPKAFKKVIKLRKIEADQRIQQEESVKNLMSKLGM